MSYRTALLSLLLVFAAVPSIQAWDMAILGFSSQPAIPSSKQPFEIILDISHSGCTPALESVVADEDVIQIRGLAGPPVNGGCGGGAPVDFRLTAPVHGLPAGHYAVEAAFFTRREGELTESATWQLSVGETAIPTLSLIPLVLLALAIGLFGLRRLAA